MKRHRLMSFAVAFFCLVLLIPFGGTVAAPPQAESEDEAQEETDTAAPWAYEFTVERETLTMPDGVKLAVSYWMPVAKKAGEKRPERLLDFKPLLEGLKPAKSG